MRAFSAAERRRAAGLPVYNLAIGQPGTGAPAAVLQAARQALSRRRLGYTDALGLAELRAAISAHIAQWHQIPCDPANVVVTTGSSGAFLTAFLAAFDVGDVVAMARPGYPAYRNILASLGCVVHQFECGLEHGFVPDVAALEALPPDTKGLILASPANPTGAMVSRSRLAEIVSWCADRRVRLISDEIYHGITFTGPADSAWRHSNDVIVVNSFSKYFSMTGWRLGWLLVPDHLIDAVSRLAANHSICPPALSQWAGLAAFDSYDELDANVARYAASRELILDTLPQIGLPDHAPADGAFYVYIDVSKHTDDSLSWSADLLADTGVALAPGLDFDPVAGAGWVRMSFAGEPAEISGGLDALSRRLA